MAVVTANSVEYAANAGQLQDNTIQKNRLWPAEGAKMRLAHFTVVLAAQADITSVINLVNIPQGFVRLLPLNSLLNCSAGGAGATLDVGVGAYTASDGKTAVAAAGTDIVATKDVSAAIVIGSPIGVTVMKKDYFSAKGFKIYGTVRGANFPAAMTIEGFIAYEIVQ